jgi:hypothetical protein
MSLALIRCPECKQKISSDCVECPKCGANIERAFRRLQASGWLMLKVVLVFIFICYVLAFLNKKEVTVSFIEDVNQYSHISSEELISKLGEPVSKEIWTNKTSKGDFEVETYSYEKDSNHYEFIVAHNTVVRLKIYSNKTWNNEGDLFFYKNKKKIPSLFGVEISKDATIENENRYYKATSVSNTIATFDVQDIRPINDTFASVEVTYNDSYFD